ncbi:RNA polymerase sigma factor [bacterium]|nr:RNA polymerase sigma factor [bacterium]
MKMDKCEGKTDEELVELTLKDQNFLVCLTRKYEAKLLSYILRISNVSKEEAEDILQEVFIKAYYNLNSFDKELKFSSWIYRITHNQVISNFRKIKARAEIITSDIRDEIIKNIASEFDVKEEIDGEIFKEKIEIILNNIDNKYKEVLVLYLLEEKSSQEISDILKKRIGTVYSLISRGKKLLKKELLKING